MEGPHYKRDSRLQALRSKVRIVRDEIQRLLPRTGVILSRTGPSKAKYPAGRKSVAVLHAQRREIPGIRLISSASRGYNGSRSGDLLPDVQKVFAVEHRINRQATLVARRAPHHPAGGSCENVFTPP